MKLSRAILILVLVSFFSFAFTATQSDQKSWQQAILQDEQEYWQQYDEASNLLEKNKPQLALQIFENLLKEKQHFHVAIGAARSAAETNQPDLALKYYELALQNAGDNIVFQRTALFGIAKMQVWLEQNTKAVVTYKKLLPLNLSDEEKKLVLNHIAALSEGKGTPWLARATQDQKVNKSTPESNRRMTRSSHSKPNFYAVIRQSITSEQYEKAANLLAAAKDKLSFEYLFYMGKLAAIANKPKLALFYFQQAYRRAASDDDRRAALFSLGNIHLWLENYGKARVVYAVLLSEPLNPGDHEIALSGFVSARSNQDYPMDAFHLIPPNFIYTDPSMLLNASQAANWAGIGYRAKFLLQQNKALLTKIPKYSKNYRLMREITWDTLKQTSKNTFHYDYYSELDSDDFYINRYTVGFTHRFTPTSATSLYATYGNYYMSPTQIDASVIHLSHQFFLNDYLLITSDLGGASIENWNPVLWNFGINYLQTNYFGLSLFNSENYVETISSLQNHISQNSTDLSVNVHPVSRLFWVGSYFHQHFTDENNRDGIYTRLMVLLSRKWGISTGVRYRYYENSLQTPNYFSPAKYQEYVAVAIFRRKFTPTWRFYAMATVGKQMIDENHPEDVISYEAGLSGALSNQFEVRVFTGYSSAADTSATGFARNYFGFQSLYYFEKPIEP